MNRFVLHFLIYLSPIVLIIAYYSIAVEPHRYGDIGGVGFLAFDDTYIQRVNIEALDSVYFSTVNNLNELPEHDSIILTIGDSFSQQGRVGYQNYLSILYPQYHTINITSSDFWNNFQYVDELFSDNGFRNSIVIVESVERAFVRELAKLTFVKQESIKTSQKAEIELAGSKNGTTPNWSIDYSKQLIANTQHFIKKRCGITQSIKQAKLKNAMFTCKSDEQTLYFLKNDICFEDFTLVENAKTNLLRLFNIAKSKDINLVFLVAADKYDLYKSFILNDSYSVSCPLDYFKEFNDDIRFLNSKELLLPHLHNGEKDIYLCNDSHWSIYAAQYVAEEIKRKLDLQFAESWK